MRDVVSDIIAYESGEMTHREIVDFFQYLVDTDMAWHLQGHYGRVAQDLILMGEVKPKKRETGGLW